MAPLTALASSIADCLEALADLDDLKSSSSNTQRLRTFNWAIDRFVRLGLLYSLAAINFSFLARLLYSVQVRSHESQE